jgi:hypothetical protein
MIVLTAEEAAVFELLDPSSSRRLVISRTGKAFVWDPITSTREVPFEAAQSLVKSGVVIGGRIAPEHVALWREPAPGKPVVKKAAAPHPAAKAAAAVREPVATTVSRVFDKTLPLGMTVSSLQAMG